MDKVYRIPEGAPYYDSGEETFYRKTDGVWFLRQRSDDVWKGIAPLCALEGALNAYLYSGRLGEVELPSPKGLVDDETSAEIDDYCRGLKNCNTSDDVVTRTRAILTLWEREKKEKRERLNEAESPLKEEPTRGKWVAIKCEEYWDIVAEGEGFIGQAFSAPDARIMASSKGLLDACDALMEYEKGLIRGDLPRRILHRISDEIAKARGQLNG